MSRFLELEDLTYLDDSELVPGDIGLFALDLLEEGDTFLIDVGLRVPNIAVNDTLLEDYVFPTDRPYESAVALGGASMVNHSETPNCKIIIHDAGDPKKVAVQLIALGTVAVGEELTIDYGDIQVVNDSELITAQEEYDGELQ